MSTGKLWDELAAIIEREEAESRTDRAVRIFRDATGEQTRLRIEREQYERYLRDYSDGRDFS